MKNKKQTETQKLSEKVTIEDSDSVVRTVPKWSLGERRRAILEKLENPNPRGVIRRKLPSLDELDES